MSIATLKAELLRELAVAALGDTGHFQPIGAGTDLLNMMSGPPDRLRRAWVLNDKGPALIVAHVPHGSSIWFAPGSRHWETGSGMRSSQPERIVVTDVVHRTDDAVGVTRLHIEVPYERFSTLDSAASLQPGATIGPVCLVSLFAPERAVTRFLENVLAGHVQDA